MALEHLACTYSASVSQSARQPACTTVFTVGVAYAWQPSHSQYLAVSVGTTTVQLSEPRACPAKTKRAANEGALVITYMLFKLVVQWCRTARLLYLDYLDSQWRNRATFWAPLLYCHDFDAWFALRIYHYSAKTPWEGLQPGFLYAPLRNGSHAPEMHYT